MYQDIGLSSLDFGRTLVNELEIVPHLLGRAAHGNTRKLIRIYSTLHDVHCALVEIGLHDLISCPCIVVL